MATASHLDLLKVRGIEGAGGAEEDPDRDRHTEQFARFAFGEDLVRWRGWRWPALT
jgi:hypothetical protein